MPYLIHRNPDGSTNEFWNLHGPPTTVGRGREVNAPIADPQLSRQHFAIRETAGVFLLKDLGSSNGTRVNGQAVTEHVLKPNDVIQAGSSSFLFMDGVATMVLKLDPLQPPAAAGSP